jgi:predicted DNA-binding protein
MAETSQEKREATSIKIKPELWKEAKIEAIREGKTVSELLEEAVESWIEKQKAKMKK